MLIVASVVSASCRVGQRDSRTGQHGKVVATDNRTTELRALVLVRRVEWHRDAAEIPMLGLDLQKDSFNLSPMRWRRVAFDTFPVSSTH